MKNLQLLLGLYIILWSPSLVASTVDGCLQSLSDITEKPSIIGLARDKDTKKSLYCEYHYREPQTKAVTVEYRTLTNELIAKKQLDFSLSLLSPSVIQTDLRHGELRQVTKVAGNEALQVAYRKPYAEEIKQDTLEITDNTPIVVDAGFDQAVKYYWDTLLAGDKMTIDFVSPLHLKAFNLEIALSDDDQSCLSSDYNPTQQVCFLIKPANNFLKLFVQPLGLIYDRESRLLMTYMGSVNITSEDGKTQKAAIHYIYDENQSSQQRISLN